MTILIEILKGLRSPIKTSQIMNASTVTSLGHIAINCPMKEEGFKHMLLKTVIKKKKRKQRRMKNPVKNMF